ncbi:MAG: hypothetical protein JO110_05810 [Acetobacteraceae bacterium]|nr:hypothetical protein [Acetobacteraceae bacterium]
MLSLMLDSKYVAIKLRNPLPSFHSQFEMSDRLPDIWFHLAPEETRISLGQVGGAGVI